MRNRVIGFSVLLVCLAAAALPACAGTVYDNGPTNGQTDAWTINFGFIASNKFSCCREAAPDAGGTVTGLQFAAWLAPGDTLQSVEVLVHLRASLAALPTSIRWSLSPRATAPAMSMASVFALSPAISHR